MAGGSSSGKISNVLSYSDKNEESAKRGGTNQ